MSTPRPFTIQSKPGIKRDGTEFEGDYYTDGLWCRFQRGKPRKIGGYTATTSRLSEKVYGMGSFSADLNNYLHLGLASTLQQAVIDTSGVLSSLNDRTPAAFVANANNVWQFANLPSAVAGATDLIAHAAPNLADIASTVDRRIYYGQADLATVLVATGLDQVSGGATTIGPYVFGYGSAGFVNWSAPNDPTTQQNLARITGQKIVFGRPLRGGGGGPAGIFWSLDAVIRAVFDPAATGGAGSPEFDFDELATELSILSPRSVVEYNGVFYWWDNSGPLMFNGVVREVPNDLNINYLLDNLNYAWRHKMFVMKVPRYGEIWWCVPLFGATECNWAIILNVRENTWYDTALPGSGRTSGLYAQVYPKPFMTDADETATGFSLWQHETGANSIKGANVEPIRSHYTTANISAIDDEQAVDKALRVAIVEPDFVQVGEMRCTINGKANARSPSVSSDPATFPADNGSLGAGDQVVRFKENRREMTFTFESNTPDGDYQQGKVIGHLEVTDGRITQ